MKRLFKNKILIFNSISTTLYLLGIIGYWTFMPKYFETQFHKSASTASLITDTRCDYFGWSPDWMQKLTDIKVYIVVYGLVGLVEGAVGSYGVATLTTIEKRFKLPSHISGLSVSSWDIGLVCSTFFLAYLGNSGRKPRWVAYGTFMAGVLCISNVLPHLIFGAGEDAMSLAKSDNSSDQVEQESCVLESNENTIAAILLIVSNLVLGMCSCTYYTLGFTYLDDNSSKDKAPFILALVFCIRLIGPTLGFTLAAKCLKLFIDPTIQPKITNDDPRWVGWIFFGIGNMILAICMFPFPKRLPNASNTSEGLENNSKGRTIKGSVGLACTALGIISSGIVISYFKPSPRYLAGWNVLVESLDVLGHFCFAFFGCPIGNIQGSWDLSGWNMTQSCNADLLCDDDIKYNPMCADDGSTTFFSPCHAGCISEVLNASMVYVNCSCSADGIIDKGVCPVDCNYNFIIFLILLCILRYSSASGRAANTMIQFRLVLCFIKIYNFIYI
ncbi:hypothetical protein AAG570_013574 [Ranatra chinensis]|uniref:Kazal-like domain-containing protein n=1 Tax=Ranatra chinensis TaxID=642074 RepID=A0ABD0YP78_9HEMI